MRPELPLATDLDTKCARCPGTKCCTYITQQVGVPRSRADFDHLLWQVSHRGISLYKDQDGWYLLISTVCDHLQHDGRCGIYETRPQVCRDYSNDYCEFDEPAEQHFDLLFEDHASLSAYVATRFRSARAKARGKNR